VSWVRWFEHRSVRWTNVFASTAGWLNDKIAAIPIDVESIQSSPAWVLISTFKIADNRLIIVGTSAINIRTLVYKLAIFSKVEAVDPSEASVVVLAAFWTAHHRPVFLGAVTPFASAPAGRRLHGRREKLLGLG
jgi:hypothetical protein